MMKLLVLAAALAGAAAIHPTAKMVEAEVSEYSDPISLKRDFFPSGLTTKFVLLGLYSPNEGCKEQFEEVAFRGVHRFAGPDLLAVAVAPASSIPEARCECACAAVIRKGHGIDSFVLTRTVDRVHFTRWMHNQVRVSMTLRNGFPHPIKLEWHEEGHDGRPSGFLEPGQGTAMNTFLSHVFAARHPDTGELLDWMAADGADDFTFRPENLQHCDDDGKDCDRSIFLRFTDFTHHTWYSKRQGLNYVQPRVVPAVTDAGFEHRKLPEKAWKNLKAWYDQHEVNGRSEPPVGPCMNQHVAPSYVAHYPPREKEMLSRELQPILEEWVHMDLHMTSIYGVRKYTRGAELHMHVDTVNTHVASAIINVAQNVTTDWKLEILDHDGNPHEIVMQPGDMVLYESARLLHGRPEPLDGEHYDNIFVHFAPNSGWDFDWM